jgi:hypothetical protein
VPQLWCVKMFDSYRYRLYINIKSFVISKHNFQVLYTFFVMSSAAATKCFVHNSCLTFLYLQYPPFDSVCYLSSSSSKVSYRQRVTYDKVLNINGFILSQSVDSIDSCGTGVGHRTTIFTAYIPWFSTAEFHQQSI